MSSGLDAEPALTHELAQDRPRPVAQASSVEITWVLADDGNDAATSSELRVPVGDAIDAADCSRPC
jgi:hypothetical protein